MFGMGGPENHHPQSGKEPVCPYSQLIEVAAKLAGVEINKDNFFCGTTPRKEDTLGVLSGFRGTIYEPKSDCSEIYIKLSWLIYETERNDIPDERTINMLSRQLPDEKKTFERYKEGVTVWKEKKRKIIPNWRQIIWENFCGKIEEQNRHWGGITRPKDLTNKQVISFVKNVAQELRKIANTNSTNYSVSITQGDMNLWKTQCRQSPRERKFGQEGLTSNH
jgi:hypothetical protein